MTAHNSKILLQPADPLGDDAIQLLRDMRAEALRRYGDIIDASAPPATNEPLVPRSVFLIARLAGQPVGCAALRPMNAEIVEVKRVYVAPSVRRRGIARRLLAELEGKAIKLGYAIVRLETGNRQPEAVALYESRGFRRIAPYGCHVDDPLSICFEKELTREGTVPPTEAGGVDGGIAIRFRIGHPRPAAPDAQRSVATVGLCKTSLSCE
jgi:GNAT superfamily N-acetyltransferase